MCGSFLMDVMIAGRRFLPLLGGLEFSLSLIDLQQCPPETSHLLCSDASSNLMKSLRTAVQVGNPEFRVCGCASQFLAADLPDRGIKPALPKWLVQWLAR